MSGSTVVTLGYLMIAAATVLTGCGGGGSSTGPSGQVPASLELMSGDNQIGDAGSALPNPIVARVKDASGTVIRGVNVSIMVVSGDGAVPASYTTDYSGRVFIVWTMGTHLRDTNTIRISTGTVTPVLASAKSEVPANVQIVFVGTPPFTPAGQPLAAPLTSKVTLPDGRPLAGAPIQWRIEWDGSEVFNACACGDFTAQDTIADASGIAHVQFTMGAPPHGALLITSRVLAMNQAAWAIKSAQTPLSWTVAPYFVALASGFDHSCALTSAGAAYCWGYNESGTTADGGEVGNTSGLPTNQPLSVDGGHVFAQLALGAYHSCGLTAAQQLYCWGDNRWGEFGDGTQTSQPSPTAIATSPVFTSIVAGYLFTCGLTADGTTYCWGHNNFGVLGDSTKIDRLTPVPVHGGHHFTSLVPLAGNAVCALGTDGLTYCWGYNSTGRLGDATTVDHLTPQPIAGGFHFTQLMGGADHACGLTGTGTAYCWGDNSAGQLGDGTVIQRSSPTLVVGGITFQSLASGLAAYFSCGVAAGGTAYCWGDDYAQELGQGKLTTPALPVCHGPGFNVFCSPTPLRVFGPHLFTQLTTNLYSVCGRTVDEGAYCWGDNTVGQNGDGFNGSDEYTPSLVVVPTGPVIGGRTTHANSSRPSASPRVIDQGAQLDRTGRRSRAAPPS